MHGYSSDPKDQELGLYKGFGGFSALQIGTLEVSPIRKFKKNFFNAETRNAGLILITFAFAKILQLSLS